MRGDIDVETLLKVILVLAIVWFALEVLDVFLHTLETVLTLLPKIVGLALIVLVVLYLFDRL